MKEFLSNEEESNLSESMDEEEKEIYPELLKKISNSKRIITLYNPVLGKFIDDP